MKYWVDDRLLLAADARISVLDHGFTVGDGVFETLKTVLTPSSELVPFAADRHLARLTRSAAGMGMPAPDPELVEVAMLAVCAANDEQLAAGGRLRVTYTSGAGGAGSERGNGPATLVVTAARAVPWPATTSALLSRWPRNERGPLAGLKSTSYAENAMALTAARQVGVSEALLANLAGDLCEGTGSNVFLIMDGTAVTPALDSGCLPGITRELVLEWGAGAGLSVREGRLRPADLRRATGCFLTSSTRDVHRVTRVLDAAESSVAVFPAEPVGTDLAVGTDLIGEIAALFAERSASNPNP
ncbi:MAG: aminotransferase class IV [Candidatus Nanopelagicales bacterium]